MKTQHALIGLCRLDGCDQKVTVEYRGKSVYVQDPTQPGKTYRLNAEQFLAGKMQIRDGWYFEPWSDKAEKFLTDKHASRGYVIPKELRRA